MTDPANTLKQDIFAREMQVWDALMRGDAVADDAALDAGFLGVYSDGFAGKADHVGQLDHGPTVASFALSDARLMELGADHCLLSYRADFQRQGSRAGEAMYVSSVWKRAGAGWVNVFSQDTPAVDA